MSGRLLEDGRAPLATAKSQLALGVGAIIDDRYQVTSAMGSGGMGEVYEVIHLGLRKAFALKCLKETALDDERATQRFIKEIRGLAAVHSEFVVAICDCGRLDNGSPYFVMERLRGQDLRKVLAESDALAMERAVRIAIDACLGLQAVHDAGLVHRDLKPENLFVTLENDDSERCKVLDFGIAKEVGTGSTKQHSLIGTLKYMAPEQLADPGGVGPATDIYALGAILYECLAGRPPQVAETEPELMFKIMNGEPPALATLLPSLDPTLCSIVTRTLERDPERRYPSAVALAGALSSRLVAYRDDDQGGSIAPQARGGRKLWVFAGLAACVPLGLALAFVNRSSSAEPPPSALPSASPRIEHVAVATPCPAVEPAAEPPPSAAPAPAAPTSVHLRKAGGVQPTSRSVRPTMPSLDQVNPYE